MKKLIQVVIPACNEKDSMEEVAILPLRVEGMRGNRQLAWSRKEMGNA